MEFLQGLGALADKVLFLLHPFPYSGTQRECSLFGVIFWKPTPSLTAGSLIPFFFEAEVLYILLSNP